jgi:hypothetical protein
MFSGESFKKIVGNFKTELELNKYVLSMEFSSKIVLGQFNCPNIDFSKLQEVKPGG